MTNHDDTVEAIFNQAIAVGTPEERRSYLEQACGDDLDLRRRVEALLSADKNAEDFLENRLPGGEILSLPIQERPGSTIGRYKLLQQIGEGGFGVVYMAEQQQPVRRRVALKIIKLGMDTKQVIARFEAERQALALMDHPHIAKVLDAGATETGRPYFVMELVHGVPITQFCDENSMNTEQRLKLFMDVCSAIHHAHQKGIIHRDIKPTNVMITLHDDKAVAKIIDFGIAKATQHRLTEQTLFTEYGRMIGTPAYMSPEQAHMSGLDIDTRSDIYSLGVLLYELFTGRTPLDAKDLKKAGYEEMRRRIREDEPATPSVCLSRLTAAELTTIAKRRRCEPSRLSNVLRGELDWIVMKAMEKDRSRRYDTANAFRLDIQRFLNDESVSAVAPGMWYEFTKFSKRNKAALAVTAAIMASLVLGLGLAVYSYLRERDAHLQAEVRRQDAVRARIAESKQRQKAEASQRRARQLQYASDMMVAFTALQRNDIALARKLLSAHVPSHGAPDLRGWEWRHLWRMCNREIATIPTHKSISDIVASPDGRFLAVAGKSPNSVKIVDVASLQITQSLPLERTTWVAGMSFLPDDRSLAVECKQNQGVWLFDLVTKSETHLVPESSRSNLPRLSPDQQWLIGLYDAANDGAKILRCFDVATNQEVESSTPFSIPDPWMLDHEIRISPDGKLIAVGCHPNRVRLFSVPDLEDVGAIEIGGEVKCVSWSPDCQTLAVAVMFPNVTEFWDVHSQQPVCQPLQGTQRAPGFDMSFSREGSLLAVVGDGQTVVVWDLRTQTEQAVYLHSANSVVFLPDGKTLATGGRDGTLKLWDTTPTRETPLQKADVNDIMRIEFSPDGRLLAATAADGVVRLFDSASENLIDELQPEGVQVDRSVKFPHSDAPLCFSSDGQLLVAGNGDHTASVYDLSSRKQIHLLTDHTAVIRDIALNSNASAALNSIALNSNIIVTASDDKTLRFWDAATGSFLSSLPATAPMNAVDFSPDGKLIAFGGSDGALTLWDITRQKKIQSASTDSRVDSIEFSPNGQLLACGLFGELRLFEIPSLKQRAFFPLQARVTSLSFSPDGDNIVAVCLGGMVRLINLRVMSDVGDLLDVSRTPEWLLSVRFSPDGETIAASGRRDGIRLFHSATLNRSSVGKSNMGGN